MGHFKSPDAEENVGCNLIPMIDIMFLLLLFFMLGADMTQRELEDVALPKEDMVKEEKKERDQFGRTTVNVYHSSKDPCAEFEKGVVCSILDHWKVAISGPTYNWEGLEGVLREQAALDLAKVQEAGAKVKISERTVSIRADKKAPFGIVQRVLETCSKVGLYKTETGASKPGPD